MKLRIAALAALTLSFCAGSALAQGRTTVCDPKGLNCLQPNAAGGFTTTAATPSYTILPAASTSGTPQAAQAGGYGIALPSAGAFGSGNAITVTDAANNGAVRQYTTYSASQAASICVSAGDTVSATSTVGNQTQAVNLNFNPSVVCGGPSSVSVSGYASTDGSTTQTAGGTAQALFGGATPVHGWKVGTPGASNCYASDTTTTPSLTTTGSVEIFANGGQYATEPGQLPAGPVYVTCPTTGQVISAQRW